LFVCIRNLPLGLLLSSTFFFHRSSKTYYYYKDKKKWTHLGATEIPSTGTMTTEKTRVEESSKTKKKGVQEWKRAQAIADVAQDANHNSPRRHHSRSVFAVVWAFHPPPPPNACPPLVNFANFFGNPGYSELLWRVKG
jgi:hypothetical protein